MGWYGVAGLGGLQPSVMSDEYDTIVLLVMEFAFLGKSVWIVVPEENGRLNLKLFVLEMS